MGKTCTDLFAGIDCTVIGNADEEVGGIAYRSDRVQPGDAFFCIVGLTADGHSFAQDAIDRGAKVLVVERKVYLADATDVTEVVVADTRKAMAAASANFYDHPSKDFALVGITGTNGKTTTTYLVEHIAHVAGKRTGVIGTVGVRIGGEQEKTAHTTPESPDLQKLLARMRDERCGVVAMEVSSHALDLERTWGTTFAVTAFSNLMLTCSTSRRPTRPSGALSRTAATWPAAWACGRFPRTCASSRRCSFTSACKGTAGVGAWPSRPSASRAPGAFGPCASTPSPRPRTPSASTAA